MTEVTNRPKMDPDSDYHMEPRAAELLLTELMFWVGCVSNSALEVSKRKVRIKYWSGSGYVQSSRQSKHNEYNNSITNLDKWWDMKW